MEKKTPEEQQQERLNELAGGGIEETKAAESEKPKEQPNTEGEKTVEGDFVACEDAMRQEYETLKNNQSVPGGIDSLAKLYGGIFNMALAKQRGEHWALNRQELVMLSGATDECIRQYFPSFSVSPAVLLLGVVGMIAVPRVQTDLELLRAWEEEQAKATGDNRSD